MSTTTETGLPPPIPGGEALLTKAQLAQHLGKSERTIDNWRKQIGLPCLKVKHSVFFRLSDVMRHIEKTNGHAMHPEPPAGSPINGKSAGSAPTT